MDELEKKVLEIVAKDSFGTTCRQCAFFPGGDSGMCLAPWSDFQMEDEDIDPCYEGVYRYITGKPGPHLRKALDLRPATVWLREKGKRGGAKNQAGKWNEGGHPMSKNYLRRIRRQAKRFRMAVRKNRTEEGGYLLIRLEDDFNVFGGPVDLEDIEA